VSGKKTKAAWQGKLLQVGKKENDQVNTTIQQLAAYCQPQSTTARCSSNGSITMIMGTTITPMHSQHSIQKYTEAKTLKFV